MVNATACVLIGIAVSRLLWPSPNCEPRPGDFSHRVDCGPTLGAIIKARCSLEYNIHCIGGSTSDSLKSCDCHCKHIQFLSVSAIKLFL